jgi:phosphoenolpyruvate synthase/pyruvate phosphate dikinase
MNLERWGLVNPMLGHRDCRLGFTYAELTKMQAKAIVL